MSMVMVAIVMLVMVDDGGYGDDNNTSGDTDNCGQ